MGTALFANLGVDIAQIIADNMGESLLPAVLKKQSNTGVPDPSNEFNVPTTSVDIDCRGFVEQFPDNVIDGTKIKVEDRKIILLGDTIDNGNTVPDINDIVVIEDREWTIVGPAKRDPAAATYEFQGR